MTEHTTTIEDCCVMPDGAHSIDLPGKDITFELSRGDIRLPVGGREPVTRIEGPGLVCVLVNVAPKGAPRKFRCVRYNCCGTESECSDFVMCAVGNSESEFDAAKRGLAEQLGIIVDPLDLKHIGALDVLPCLMSSRIFYYYVDLESTMLPVAYTEWAYDSITPVDLTADEIYGHAVGMPASMLAGLKLLEISDSNRPPKSE